MTKHMVILLAAWLALGPGPALAQISDGVIKIGVLNDQSSLYADLAGQGSVVAARMAVEDFGAEKKGMKVEVIFADHQNKPDVGSAIARQWYDVDKVDVIVDVPNSGVALAINQIAREKGKALLVSGAATADLTGKACSPNTIHWTYDTWALANGTGNAIVKTGGDTWFFITADYAFGHALERDVEAVVLKNGGKVLGKVRHPLNTADFSSFLLQAQASKAKIVGLANAGGDTTNSIKQAAEFGIVKGGQNLAGLLVFITDVHALGLPTAQGLIFTETFYWDANDRTRAFAKRFAERDKGIHPTMIHAGVYSAVLHYLKAVEALKGDDGTKVIAKMKELPTDDPLFGKGTVRADGRKLHPAYLFEVKKPAESKAPWDYYKTLATIPAEQAFRPIDQGDCPLVNAEHGLRAGSGPDRSPPRPRSLMSTVFGVPTQALFGQLLIGLINGSFYALLSLGLSVIFGLLNIINFTHGAQYMMGAFVAYFLLQGAGLGYWWALLLAPLTVGLVGIVLERTMLRRLYHLDHLYGLLLTFGLALIIQGLFRNQFGSSGLPYALPAELAGGRNLGFMFLPNYRAWVIACSLITCLGTWYVIERTKLGSYLRAATENPSLVQAFGINVPRMITLTYGFGVALAALAGVLAAPIYQVNPLMGADLIIVVFAVVVIGGMGSIIGSILTGFSLGIVEGMTKVFYPEASNTVIFVIMALVLLVKPTGLFGREK